MAKKKKASRQARSKKKTRSKKKIKKTKVSKKKKKKGGALVVYLGLGSNVGDREEYIEQAIFLLEKYAGLQVLRHSSNCETEPEGGSAQPLFINAAVAIKTKLDPYKLLDVCHEIEAALGREREIERGPRTIDIDILLYGDEVISDDKLQIPHPLMHERLFVLKPLNEIAPKQIHPVLEKKISVLFDERKAELGGTYDDELPGFKEIKGASFDDYERW